MLYDFLEKNKSAVLTLAEDKTLKLAGSLHSSEELRRGLPVFLDHLIMYLKGTNAAEEKIVEGASVHGKELMRLNYTLSHVVHAYGAMCQSITELVQRRNENISAKEFNELNLCLDIAIAAAVSEFQFHTVQAGENREVQHLGFLVHELRNALSSATIAHQMIKQGLVGTGGSTARVLEENLERMRKLIDRSLSEVRMRADPEVYVEKFQLNNLVDQIMLTAQSEAQTKKQFLKNEIESNIELETDRQLLLSVIANLIQNGLKYSKTGGQITVRAGVSTQNVIIEVEDSCGGISTELMKNIFKPFTSTGFNQTGLGLGLTIVQRAVDLIGGKISVRNSPGSGCAFLVDIPKKFTAPPRFKAVPGEISAQPVPTKK